MSARSWVAPHTSPGRTQWRTIESNVCSKPRWTETASAMNPPADPKAIHHRAISTSQGFDIHGPLPQAFRSASPAARGFHENELGRKYRNLRQLALLLLDSHTSATDHEAVVVTDDYLPATLCWAALSGAG